jgi:hypothetical protein
MPDSDNSSSAGASTGNLSDRSTHTNHSIDPYRKPRIHLIVGITLALTGATILGFSTRYFLFHPMTATDEYIGLRLWIVGSWLLGGGVTLTFARPWVAALVGFFAPALTFGMAMFLYIVLSLLSPLLS